VLSSAEFERALWGREFKRQVKMAAARVEVYEDAALAERVGVSRNAVTGWWRGSRPNAPTLLRLARVVGLPADALIVWVHGPMDEQAPSEDPQAFGEAALEREAQRRRRGVPQQTPE
jgi:transcriptional regulator with XRE-family HTH domain